jgi:hypothetical protein
MLLVGVVFEDFATTTIFFLPHAYIVSATLLLWECRDGLFSCFQPTELLCPWTLCNLNFSFFDNYVL